MMIDAVMPLKVDTANAAIPSTKRIAISNTARK